MIVKFSISKFERIAGIFVLMALVGSVVTLATVAIKKGWLESKVNYHTRLESAEGVHEGTMVQIAGLRAGQVTQVHLLDNNEIDVQFEVFERFQKRIKVDSKIMIVRPFVIGEKVIDITVGSPEAHLMEVGSLIGATPTTDLMDLLSGRRLGSALNDLGDLVENFKVLVTAFADRKRTESLVKVFDRLEPMVKNVDIMSRGIIKFTGTLNKDERLEVMVSQLTEFTNEMSVILPEFKKQVPNIGEQMGSLVENLNVLTEEFKKLTPTIQAIAPELPRVSLRAIEALDEVVVIMKAMQKSFLLKGNVEEVLEQERLRQPASQEDKKGE